MKSIPFTTFLHTYRYAIVLIIFLLTLMSGRESMAQSQNKKDKLPTVKVSKKKKSPPKVKPQKNAKGTKDTYSQPKTNSNSNKSKDYYRRPRSKTKGEKVKDNFQPIPSQSTKFNTSERSANINPSPPAEEGNEKPRKTFWQRIFHPKTEAEYEGNIQRKKEAEGTVGTHYQGNIKRNPLDYEQLAKDQHLYQGNIKKAPQKRLDRQFEYKADFMFNYSGGIKRYKPKKQEKVDQQLSDNIQTAGMYKVKKQRDKAAAYTSYHGQIKLPTLKARTRHLKKLSKKVHQYDGDIRYRKPGKDMHPSVYHLKAKTKSSYEQKEKYRRWRLIITHIFKGSDVPKNVKEKERKPRYDKNESEIWNY